MYYSNGNYEAFAQPKKPEGVDDKTRTSSAPAWPRSLRHAIWYETRKCQATTFTYSKRTRFQEVPAMARTFPASAT